MFYSLSSCGDCLVKFIVFFLNFAFWNIISGVHYLSRLALLLSYLFICKLLIWWLSYSRFAVRDHVTVFTLITWFWRLPFSLTYYPYLTLSFWLTLSFISYLESICVILITLLVVSMNYLAFFLVSSVYFDTLSLFGGPSS